MLARVHSSSFACFHTPNMPSRNLQGAKQLSSERHAACFVSFQALCNEAAGPVGSEAVCTTCMMFGWLSALLIAASIMAIFSRFSWPLMADGSTIVFTATVLPFHSPLYTCGMSTQLLYLILHPSLVQACSHNTRRLIECLCIKMQSFVRTLERSRFRSQPIEVLS